jgi:hypothetical protein
VFLVFGYGKCMDSEGEKKKTKTGQKANYKWHTCIGNNDPLSWHANYYCNQVLPSSFTLAQANEIKYAVQSVLFYLEHLQNIIIIIRKKGRRVQYYY